MSLMLAIKVHAVTLGEFQREVQHRRRIPGRDDRGVSRDGHVWAFAFFGGVPQSILFDNTTLAVAKILGDGTRKRTIAFSELQSHYLFEDRFGRPGKGNA
jgi:transposase